MPPNFHLTERERNLNLTLEQRIARAERVLKMFVRKGRNYRKEFREKIEILLAMQMKDYEEWLARQRALDEKINILISAQMGTDERLKSTDERMRETDEKIKALNAEIFAALDRLDRLSASQAITEETLDRFFKDYLKDRNGTSD